MGRMEELEDLVGVMIEEGHDATTIVARVKDSIIATALAMEPGFDPDK